MRQVRRGVFETNSSSTHSLTICSDEEYQAWKRGELYFYAYNEEFISAEEYEKKLAEYKEQYCDPDASEEDIKYEFMKDEGICGYEDYWDDEYLENFDETYTTKGGELIHAFGKYGYDS